MPGYRAVDRAAMAVGSDASATATHSPCSPPFSPHLLFVPLDSSRYHDLRRMPRWLSGRPMFGQRTGILCTCCFIRCPFSKISASHRRWQRRWCLDSELKSSVEGCFLIFYRTSLFLSRLPLWHLVRRVRKLSIPRRTDRLLSPRSRYIPLFCSRPLPPAC